MKCVNVLDIPVESRKPICDTGSDTLSRDIIALRKRFFDFYRYIIYIGFSSDSDCIQPDDPLGEDHLHPEVTS